MLLNWPYHSGMITQSHLRRILMDEAKKWMEQNHPVPPEPIPWGQQSQEEEVLKGMRSPLPGSVVASSA